MDAAVSLTRNHEIGIVTINQPPVNALAPGVPASMAECIQQVARDSSLAAAVILGAGAGFSAGTDLKELRRVVSGHHPRTMDLQELVRRVEDCPKPVVCAIHGACLGGGLELAMGAHYRLAAPSAILGQPEVKLGLIPSAGGTQRLPRIAGVEKALDMTWRGEPVSAEQALAMGLLDRIVTGDLLTAALAFTRALLAQGRGPRKTRELSVRLSPEQLDSAVFERARAAARKTMRGQTAPLKAIDAVEASVKMPFEEGLRFEAKLAAECLYTDQTRALLHMFFSERKARKQAVRDSGAQPAEVQKAGVIGAGTMGGGIAMAFAGAGIPVLVREASQQALDRGFKRIQSNYAASVRRGRLSQAEMDHRMALIRPTADWVGFEDADVVVEAVFEDADLKRQVFGELAAVAKAGTILATNTSSLDIDQFARMTPQPEHVLGLHFFSPANVMRLLEIVRGSTTSDAVIARSLALARRLGKIAVVVGNCLGFAGNRMFEPYRVEAQLLVEEGAAPQDVDRVLYDFGMAMGPLATGDLIGLDVAHDIRRLFQQQQRPDVRRPLVEDRLVQMGRLGQKTGAGWYRYGADRSAAPDPEVDSLIHEVVREAGIESRAVTSDEVVARTVYALVNEGARILEEGFARRASDLDVIYLNGFGFPAWRGGPMWYADTVGLDFVLQRIREFEACHGSRWTPAPLLVRLQAEGRTFAQWDEIAG